jgi:hypothetical protein
VVHSHAAAILERAWHAGIDTIDTAAAYGASEERLGDLRVGRFRVISKLPAVADDAGDVVEAVRRLVLESLGRLGIPRLRGLLLHRPLQLAGVRGSALLEALQRVRAEGLTETVGISVYGPDEIEAIWPYFRPDIVQVPFSVMDRRLASSGWLGRLREASVEVHVRSIFLQGLLLMGDRRPARFDGWGELWRRWSLWLGARRLTPVEACVRFALSFPAIDRVVVGVDSAAQLEEILAAAAGGALEVPAELVCDDSALVDPRTWDRDQ